MLSIRVMGTLVDLVALPHSLPKEKNQTPPKKKTKTKTKQQQQQQKHHTHTK